MRRQVRHSKVRSSKPRSPGEIRASPILCLQVGQDGRSVIENETRIARHQTNDKRGEGASLSTSRHLGKILAQVVERRNQSKKLELSG